MRRFFDENIRRTSFLRSSVTRVAKNLMRIWTLKMNTRPSLAECGTRNKSCVRGNQRSIFRASARWQSEARVGDAREAATRLAYEHYERHVASHRPSALDAGRRCQRDEQSPVGEKPHQVGDWSCSGHHSRRQRSCGRRFASWRAKSRSKLTPLKYLKKVRPSNQLLLTQIMAWKVWSRWFFCVHCPHSIFLSHFSRRYFMISLIFLHRRLLIRSTMNNRDM